MSVMEQNIYTELIFRVVRESECVIEPNNRCNNC